MQHQHATLHDDVIKWKHFPRYWPFVRGIHRSPVITGHRWFTGELPAQRSVTRSFDVFFDLCLTKRLSKQWRGWWFVTSSCPLWRHCNGNGDCSYILNGLDFTISYLIGGARVWISNVPLVPVCLRWTFYYFRRWSLDPLCCHRSSLSSSSFCIWP